MLKVVGVNFKPAGKIYYFDPGDLALKNEDDVIVETGRGMEFGTVRGDVREISEKEFGKSIRKVLRMANNADHERQAANAAKRDDAMSVCHEKIKKHNLDMKLIDAEYTFDNTKLVFYFTSDNRVDFRELVKDLASVFRKRIELRQVGVRDEAKILGGVGSCGRGLCCSNWLQDFEPVSIKMAKMQNLSLNPTKISGSCGRLMCCLKYENDIYQEMRKGMPNQGEVVDTPQGKAKVTESNILRNIIKVRLIEEERTAQTPEKLSADLYIYTKDEIRRSKKTGKKNEPIKSVNEEIQQALDDEIIDIVKE